VKFSFRSCISKVAVQNLAFQKLILEVAFQNLHLKCCISKLDFWKIHFRTWVSKVQFQNISFQSFNSEVTRPTRQNQNLRTKAKVSEVPFINATLKTCTTKNNYQKLH
jgi:hypothetical protein